MIRQTIFSMLVLSALGGCTWQGSKPTFDPLSICGPRRIAPPPTGSCQPNEAYYQQDVNQPVITMPGPGGSTVPPATIVPSNNNTNPPINPAGIPPYGNTPMGQPTSAVPPATLQPVNPPLGGVQAAAPAGPSRETLVSRPIDSQSPILVVENPSYRTAEQPARQPVRMNNSSDSQKWIEISRLPRLLQSQPVRNGAVPVASTLSADGWKTRPSDLQSKDESLADEAGPRCVLAAAQ